MGQREDILPDTITKVLTLLEHSSYKQYEIANLCGVSKQFVSNLSRKGHSGSKRKNCGRKKITSKRVDRLIIKTVLSNRSKTIDYIRRFLSAYYSLKISSTTIRRRLRKNGIKCCAKVKKFMLNEKMIKKRRKWAYKFRNWGLPEWSHVIFPFFFQYFP